MILVVFSSRVLDDRQCFTARSARQKKIPLDRIQGDIKPLLQHLDFRGRFRRRDLVSLIHQFHAKRSRIAPDSITECRPREANALADYFAGQASAFLLDRSADNMQQDAPIDVPSDPPYDLLLEANAVVLGPHQSGKTVLILQEVLGCDMFQMTRFAGWMDGKCAGAVKAIALATHQGKRAMSVEYISAATDGKGRLYARQISAQTLPRDLQSLLYGATHKEVDMSGAHYELIRAMCASKSLPPVRELRLWLQQAWSARLTDEGADEVQRAIKLFPLRVINSGATRALAHLATMELLTPTWLAALAYMSWRQPEMLLPPICWLWFDLVWRLSAGTGTSMRLKQWKGLLCSCFCWKYVKDALPRPSSGSMMAFGLISRLMMEYW